MKAIVKESSHKFITAIEKFSCKVMGYLDCLWGTSESQEVIIYLGWNLCRVQILVYLTSSSGRVQTRDDRHTGKMM